MIDKICEAIISKMKKEMPDIDEEKTEVIKYGIELIIGEIPKIFVIFALSFLLGIGKYMIFLYIIMMPYRFASGGFHLKSHLGCIVGTSLFYFGNIFLSKYIIMNDIQKYIVITFAFIFGIVMITLYAPADTENIPIISKRERKNKKILSYVFLSIMLIGAILIKDITLSNILIIGTIIQTITITRIAYKITNNKYGHEVYTEEISTIN